MPAWPGASWEQTLLYRATGTCRECEPLTHLYRRHRPSNHTTRRDCCLSPARCHQTHCEEKQAGRRLCSLHSPSFVCNIRVPPANRYWQINKFSINSRLIAWLDHRGPDDYTNSIETFRLHYTCHAFSDHARSRRAAYLFQARLAL